jgi:hypothetical protein
MNTEEIYIARTKTELFSNIFYKGLTKNKNIDIKL